MSHLTDFVQLYSRFGVTCKVNKHEEGYNVILTEDIHADITDTASEKFEGYNGFYTEVIFNHEGQFIRQGFWE